MTEITVKRKKTFVVQVDDDKAAKLQNLVDRDLIFLNKNQGVMFGYKKIDAHRGTAYRRVIFDLFPEIPMKDWIVEYKDGNRCNLTRDNLTVISKSDFTQLLMKEHKEYNIQPRSCRFV